MSRVFNYLEESEDVDFSLLLNLAQKDNEKILLLEKQLRQLQLQLQVVQNVAEQQHQLLNPELEEPKAKFPKRVAPISSILHPKKKHVKARGALIK